MPIAVFLHSNSSFLAPEANEMFCIDYLLVKINKLVELTNNKSSLIKEVKWRILPFQKKRKKKKKEKKKKINKEKEKNTFY